MDSRLLIFVRFEAELLKLWYAPYVVHVCFRSISSFAAAQLVFGTFGYLKDTTLVNFCSVPYTLGFGGTLPILFCICLEAKLKSPFRVTQLHIYILERSKQTKVLLVSTKLGCSSAFTLYKMSTLFFCKS